MNKSDNNRVNRKLAAVHGSCGASPAPVWPFPVTTGVMCPHDHVRSNSFRATFGRDLALLAMERLVRSKHIVGTRNLRRQVHTTMGTSYRTRHNRFACLGSDMPSFSHTLALLHFHVAKVAAGLGANDCNRQHRGVLFVGDMGICPPIHEHAHNMKLKRTAKIVTPFAFRKSCANFVCRLTWCYGK